MDDLEAVTYNTGADFLAGCGQFLMENEIANNYPLGVAPRLQENNLLFSINQRSTKRVLLTGLSEIEVGSLSLVTYETDEKLVKCLVAHVTSYLQNCPLTTKLIGLTAPESLVHPIKEFLNTNFKAEFNFRTNLRCYVCTAVAKDALELADRTPGSMVIATESHLEETANLMREFEEQVHRPAERLSDERTRVRLQKFMSMQRVWIWIDEGKVTSIVVSTRDTESAQGINSVYTPTSCRRKGYATALVAKVAQFMIEKNNKKVFLYADLDYPASNKVYTNVGFVPVADPITWAK
jgi:hypothetical protein